MSLFLCLSFQFNFLELTYHLHNLYTNGNPGISLQNPQSYSLWIPFRINCNSRAIFCAWILILSSAIPVALAHSVRLYYFKGRSYTACVFSTEEEGWSLIGFQVITSNKNQWIVFQKHSTVVCFKLLVCRFKPVSFLVSSYVLYIGYLCYILHIHIWFYIFIAFVSLIISDFFLHVFVCGAIDFDILPIYGYVGPSLESRTGL